MFIVVEVSENEVHRRAGVVQSASGGAEDFRRRERTSKVLEEIPIPRPQTSSCGKQDQDLQSGGDSFRVGEHPVSSERAGVFAKPLEFLQDFLELLRLLELYCVGCGETAAVSAIVRKVDGLFDQAKKLAGYPCWQPRPVGNRIGRVCCLESHL